MVTLVTSMLNMIHLERLNGKSFEVKCLGLTVSAGRYKKDLREVE